MHLATCQTCLYSRFTKWKRFEDNYVEIVPSSNPESHSSFFDSQSDWLLDLCVAEEFFVVPLEALPEGKLVICTKCM